MTASPRDLARTELTGTLHLLRVFREACEGDEARAVMSATETVVQSRLDALDHRPRRVDSCD